MKCGDLLFAPPDEGNTQHTQRTRHHGLHRLDIERGTHQVVDTTLQASVQPSLGCVQQWYEA